MGRKIVLLILLVTQTVLVCAQQTANEKQARRIFNQAYNQVFGEQGATLHYDVNIVGVYKTSGTIWYKGKKQKFVDEKVNTWNDGTTVNVSNFRSGGISDDMFVFPSSQYKDWKFVDKRKEE